MRNMESIVRLIPATVRVYLEAVAILALFIYTEYEVTGGNWAAILVALGTALVAAISVMNGTDKAPTVKPTVKK
jgi:uncharacterized protein (DUF983 family)